ncbi:APC family permease [Pediococcus acidilactici]|nr:APC family permease [Pediococcus acidilactici]
MENSPLDAKKRYISWPVVALMDFVTVIGFDDLIYNFHNQGLAIVSTWVLMILLFVWPYEMMVGQLGGTFNEDGGGLASWVRATNGDLAGYIVAFFYWIAGLPYVVDVANSVVVSISWLVKGNGDLQSYMPTIAFALFTAVVFLVFIWFQHFFRNRSLEILSTLGGGAMFVMTILFVVMTVAALMHGRHIATQPFNARAFIPKIDGHFLSTFGLLIFAINGAELAAPYVKEMKDGKRDFPKAMMMLLLMTIFLTVFGSFSLAVFFNAHHLPYDLKMNGSYYAFQALGKEFRIGDTLMYIFAVSQALYMFAQLAVILDASTRIVSPFVTSFVFFAFMRIRQKSKKFHSDYVFIKNDVLAWLVGAWCFVITIVFSLLGVRPTDATPGTALYDKELALNIIIPVIFIALSALLPYMAWVERNHLKKTSRASYPFAILTFIVGAYLVIKGHYSADVWSGVIAWGIIVVATLAVYFLFFNIFRKSFKKA